MKENLSKLSEEFKAWEADFEAAIGEMSSGPYEKEIIRAREIFLEKLGRSHEMNPELYEAVSQTFLEWYFYDFRMSEVGKVPLELYLERHGDSDSPLSRSQFNIWSLFLVRKIKKEEVVLEDLISKQDWSLYKDPDNPSLRAWAVEKKQVIQARLYQFFQQQTCFCTQVWVHPKKEAQLLSTICEERRDSDRRDDRFLLASFQALIRTLQIRDQMDASRRLNWLYEQLWKAYA